MSVGEQVIAHVTLVPATIVGLYVAVSVPAKGAVAAAVIIIVASPLPVITAPVPALTYVAASASVRSYPISASLSQDASV
jgi:hypothetical protein